MTVFGVPSNRQYYKKFKFIVEIQGVAFAGFTTMSELRGQVAVVEQYEGGSLIPNKDPGRVTFPNVTLSRGATDDEDLWTWFKETVAVGSLLVSPDNKRTLDVVQQDRAGTEQKRWTLYNAWPTEFKAGDWDNGADENTMEEVVLAYDYFDVGGDAA